ncbi:hypothetical protein C8R46DRAFT_1052867, partial [Mycena filopes]
FLHTHWYYLPVTRYIARGAMCVQHVLIMLSLCKDRDMVSAIRATPGVLRVVAAAWKATIGDRSPISSLISHSPAGRLNLAVETVSLLVKGGLSTSQFDDILEGVGGTFHNLASTLVQHYSHVAPNADLPITPRFFEVCSDFLQSSCPGEKQLQDALRPLGFVAPLISALSAIIPATISSRPSTVEMALLNLITLLGSSADSTIASADVKGREHMPLIIRLLKCFEDSVALATRSKIDASTFSQDWTDFCTLARKRLIFLKSWEVNHSSHRSRRR